MTSRRTWAEWSERNRTGRDLYYARMERAGQCHALCPRCLTRCDMGEGHLYAHEFEGKCEPASFDEFAHWESGGVVGNGGPVYGTVNIEYVSDLLGEAFKAAEDMRLAKEWADDLFGGTA